MASSAGKSGPPARHASVTASTSRCRRSGRQGQQAGDHLAQPLGVRPGPQRLDVRGRPPAPGAASSDSSRSVCRDGPEPAQRLERGERADQLRLVVRVGVAALRRVGRHAARLLLGVAGPRLGQVRVRLQRQRPGGGDHLEQERQPRPEAVHHRRRQLAGRVGVDPVQQRPAGRAAGTARPGARPATAPPAARRSAGRPSSSRDRGRRPPRVRPDRVVEPVDRLRRSWSSQRHRTSRAGDSTKIGGERGTGGDPTRALSASCVARTPARPGPRPTDRRPPCGRSRSGSR